MTNQVSASARIAAMPPQCRPVPAISSGFEAAGYCCRLREPGKLKPSGFFIGPNAIQAATFCAT